MRELALDAAPVPSGGLAERPIRARRGVSASSSGPVRDSARNFASAESKTGHEAGVLTVGKTRSQSRRLEAANQESVGLPNTKERPVPTAPELPIISRQSSLRAPIKTEPRDAPNHKDGGNLTAKDELDAQSRRLAVEAQSQQVGRSGSKPSPPSGSKPRSSIGLHPLFHKDDSCELLPRSSVIDVNADLRHMLANLVPYSSARRRTASKRAPHTYVIKWVDYTNRYGIGYVLDDGSVGCVFKSGNGQPASGVVMRLSLIHI